MNKALIIDDLEFQLWQKDGTHNPNIVNFDVLRNGCLIEHTENYLKDDYFKNEALLEDYFRYRIDKYVYVNGDVQDIINRYLQLKQDLVSYELTHKINMKAISLMANEIEENSYCHGCHQVCPLDDKDCDRENCSKSITDYYMNKARCEVE